jgi:hypothetical protein
MNHWYSFVQKIPIFGNKIKIKIKLSHYMPGEGLRVPGG